MFFNENIQAFLDVVYIKVFSTIWPHQALFSWICLWRSRGDRSGTCPKSAPQDQLGNSGSSVCTSPLGVPWDERLLSDKGLATVPGGRRPHSSTRGWWVPIDRQALRVTPLLLSSVLYSWLLVGEWGDCTWWLEQGGLSFTHTTGRHRALFPVCVQKRLKWSPSYLVQRREKMNWPQPFPSYSSFSTAVLISSKAVDGTHAGSIQLVRTPHLSQVTPPWKCSGEGRR